MKTDSDRIKEIFAKAMEKKSPAEREKFLAEACRDAPELRQQVETLLRAHEQAGEFLGQTVKLAESDFALEKTGVMIGRYKLLEKIGEGGFGVVYMAEQQQPVQRKVALKIIKAGMDTREVVARFEAERQALALMDHPNIARVLDAGATEAGRPYFVMELVRGIPITEYCDRSNLPTRERLQLFMKVCNAVQHAHQKGIIHRDIKPNNVLVTLHDGEPVPKVIDFGIAKALGQKLTEKTLFTGLHHMIGTPAYMSPEQAELSGLDIDTRADIYSLGVLLYELLTGVTPFDRETLAKAALDEICRMIRETEPQKPSTRLQTLGDKLTEVAKHRQSAPAELSRLVRGDLDWVVMKTLEKDRQRRYETANALAMDLQRHLNNEPVLASPPSNFYRFQKMVRRNKLAVGAASAVTAALILGLGFSTWSFLKEREARQRAKREAERATQAQQAADAQRTRAEAEAKRANQALSMSLSVEADRLVREGVTGRGLAYVARALRVDPANRLAAQRVVCLLNQRNFPLSLPGPPDWWSPNSSRQTTVADSDWHRHTTNIVYEGTRFPAVISPDGEKLAFVTDTATVVLSTKTGQPVMPEFPTPHTGTSPFVIFTPDSRQVVIGGKADVRIANLNGSREEPKKLPHRATAHDLSFSVDGRLLAAATRTGDSYLWDAVTGLPARELCPGIISAGRVECSARGDYLVCHHEPLVQGKTFTKYWDIRPGCATPVEHHTRGAGTVDPYHLTVVNRGCFSPDGSLVATLCDDGSANVWRSSGGEVIFETADDAGKVTTIGFSPDSARFVTGTSDGGVRLWEISSGRCLMNHTRHVGRVTAILFTPDGRRLVSGADDGIVQVVELADDKMIAAVTNRLGTVMSLAISPDGARMAVGYRNHRAELWDLTNLRRIGEPMTRNFGWVWDVEFSHDGKWLLTSSGGNAAQLWDGVTGGGPLMAYPHGSGVSQARFSSDDRLVITAAQDSTGRVWDRATGKPVTEPLVHQGRFVRPAGFSPDGRKVITAGDDGVAVVWDVQTARPLSEPFRHAGGMTAACFSPDGQHVLTAGVNGIASVHEWVDVGDVAPPWLPELAEAVGGFRLSAKGDAEFLEDAAQIVIRLRQTLAALDASDPMVKWGQWFLADRRTRSISSRSTISVRTYAARLSKQNLAAALRESLDLDPENPSAYLKLAEELESKQPETAALYRRIAAELR